MFGGKTCIPNHVLGKFYQFDGVAVPYDENKISMIDFKELPEGLTLDGEYALEHWIASDAAGSFFAASSDSGEAVLAKLVPDSSPCAEAQLAVWRRSRHLRHKHLLDVRDSGRIEFEGTACIYGIFERPDDVLATALEQAPLGEVETRAVMEAALSALRYLHGQGLVHGAVDPTHVVAVGDIVKLSTDSVREADGMRARAEDVRQLGELVKTLRAPEPLAEPLETVVRHATEPDPGMRWTLAEIAVALDRPPVLSVEVAPEPEPLPVVVPIPEEPRPAAIRSSPPSPPRFPRWIFAGVAILLLAILGMNLRRKPEAPAAVAVVPSPAPAVERPAPPPQKAQPAAPRAVWRVIAFTYGSHDLAAKKARYVNGRWPDMHATVLAAKDQRGLFLVALGGALQKDEAARLQRKARGLGLPNDTYIQNFTD
jgi:eukaryotic-like serine/threonine-protein kinase